MDLSPKHDAGFLPAFLAGPWPVAVLLACHFALGLSAASRKSATFDENTYLSSGFSYWAANDYRMNPESANWSQRWVALPIWLGDYRFPSLDDPTWQRGEHWIVADRLFYNSGNDADTMLFRGRLMIALLSVALGVLVYLWSRQLFGPIGGLVSLTLYSFSPTTLSLGFIATGELMVALFFTAAIWSLWALVHRASWFNLAASCLALSGVLLSKYSGVLIIPMMVLLVAIRLCNPNPLVWNLGGRREIYGRFRQLTALFGVVVFQMLFVAAFIWASYGFHYLMVQPSKIPKAESPITLEEYLKNEGNFGFTRPFVEFAAQYHLLPEGYLYGFAHTMRMAQQREAFLNGEFSIRGWIGFFPYAMLVKTPPEVFLIVILAVAGLWLWPNKLSGNPELSPFAMSGPQGRWYSLTPLLVLWGVYWLFSLASHLNLGHRYLMPTYPPLFILAGAAANWFKATDDAKPQWTLAAPSLVLAALLFSVVEAVACWPNYLAYFNFLAGGPAGGYKHLVDSSLDWGQDLKELKPWLDSHPDDHVYLAYFGTASPKYYGIDATVLLDFFNQDEPRVSEPLKPGTYCISATLLQGIYQPMPGKWNTLFENGYQECRKRVLAYQRAANDPEALKTFMAGISQDDIYALFRDYENLRVARLCAFLRAREPDFNVGHSILIYRLDQADVKAATEGPPVELLPNCEPDVKAVLRIP